MMLQVLRPAGLAYSSGGTGRPLSGDRVRIAVPVATAGYSLRAGGGGACR